ncbi:OmpA family protein [Aestuariicella hydrocarbonica]|uniref:OmpA family protein n=1 Tax=Pseudomaricurvus hydrocarbonicus TaxID=1470433 RepID=A0A9E5JV60_9GAMM|nr:OmpA family protein [Aestuariicella hydrocarbonica]NHO65145.1 OmpA family protein [Aestuariicella hydrocarbonica]
MSRILIALFVTLAVGCMSTDPYTGEQKASNTSVGAGAGAVMGAIVGAATSSKKDRGKGALTGAVAGGAIGGGVGYYMDKQETELRNKLQGSGVQVRREGDTIRLIMPGNITFDSGQSAIRGNFYPTLNSVAVVLAEFDRTAIRVAGHTDSTGGAELNQRLSEDRANSVRQYLISQNVASGRIQTNGYGPRYPVASNNTAEGRQANRRVELELLPLDS